MATCVHIPKLLPIFNIYFLFLKYIIILKYLTIIRNMASRKSGVKCVFFNCGKSARSGNLKLYRFPKNQEICNEWILNTGSLLLLKSI